MTRSRLDLNQLLATHGDRLYGLCVRLDPDPDDAYGAVCEQLLRASSRFDPERGSFRSWSMTVAHRVLVDRFRKRRPTEPLSGREPSGAAPVEDVVVARRRAERLDQALHRLDPDHRRVVVLHHLHGVPLATIAETEGVAVGTVKSRLHRGRGHLAVLMREDS
ncbi:MAG: RNA polymerase sigma factor [Myxococcota bacterium]